MTDEIGVEHLCDKFLMFLGELAEQFKELKLDINIAQDALVKKNSPKIGPWLYRMSLS